MIGKFTWVCWVSLMSAIQRSCSSAPSTLRPMTLTPRLLHSSSSLAVAPNSVVQTGVKSAGCEKSTHQLSPMNSWKRIGAHAGRGGEVGDAVADADVALLLQLLLRLG